MPTVDGDVGDGGRSLRYYLDVVGIPVGPAEDDPPLIVDPDAVLAIAAWSVASVNLQEPVPGNASLRENSAQS